jgi:hypothetical protein
VSVQKGRKMAIVSSDDGDIHCRLFREFQDFLVEELGMDPTQAHERAVRFMRGRWLPKGDPRHREIH